VIVIPATPATESLGGAEAIGGRAKNAIELLSNQQARKPKTDGGVIAGKLQRKPDSFDGWV